jgi:hypothetical protein
MLDTIQGPIVLDIRWHVKVFKIRLRSLIYLIFFVIMTIFMIISL